MKTRSSQTKRQRVSLVKATRRKGTRQDTGDDSAESPHDQVASYDSDNSDEDDTRSLVSDALDDDDRDFRHAVLRKRKRGNKPLVEKDTRRKSSSKNRRKMAGAGESSDSDTGTRRTVVGRIVQAPKGDRVPAGQISQNTLDFLLKLQDPALNDREWFKLNEPVYRQAEAEWKAFIQSFTDLLIEADPQIPPLPPKDVIHRIYRDIRFSNDKTPYKTNISASFSRSGRKGIFAGYHVSIKPGGNSIIAGGSWCPGKNELATIRSHILNDPSRLRAAISAPEFVSCFGKAKPHPKGERQNIWGSEDELKIAPKGIDKMHLQIDLLKCRSFAVSHKFADAEVLSPSFKDELAKFVAILRPLVHCLNDYMTIATEAGSGSEDE